MSVDELASAKREVFSLKKIRDSLDGNSSAQAQGDLMHESSQTLTELAVSFPPSNLKEVEDRLRLHIKAQRIGFAGHKEAVSNILNDALGTFIDIPKDIFAIAVECLLEPPVNEDELLRTAEILQTMSARGHAIPITAFRGALQAATIEVLKNCEQDRIVSTALQRFRRVMRAAEGYASEDEEIEIMHRCADAGRWQEFWMIWRGFPASMRPRSSKLYRVMFDRLGMTQDQVEIMRCLRECVPEMEIEDPVVELQGDIAKAVKECLLIVSPELEFGGEHAESMNEWARLWRRCDKALGE